VLGRGFLKGGGRGCLEGVAWKGVLEWGFGRGLGEGQVGVRVEGGWCVRVHECQHTRVIYQGLKGHISSVEGALGPAGCK